MRSLRVAVVALLALLLLGLALLKTVGPDRPDAGNPEPPPRSAPDGAEPGAGSGTEPESLPAESPLDRSRDLHGRVTDETGEPVRSAEVVVHEYPRASLIGFRAGIRGEGIRLGADVSDATGAFRVRLPRMRQVAVSVSAAGFAPLTVFPCYSGERLHLTLRRAARLTVRVVHADESPAAAARVRLVAGRTRSSGSFEQKGEADRAGEITFDDVPTGIPFSVSAQADRGGSFVRKGFPRLDPAGDVVTVVLPVGVDLRGQVRDARTGTGIEGATVSLGFLWPRSERTTEHGNFVISGWTRQEGTKLTVAADGYATQKVEMTPDQVTVVDLLPGITVTGRVVDEHGKPISGAEASVTGVRYSDGRWSNTYGDDLTDATGRFSVPAIDGTFPLIVKAELPGYGRREIDLASPDEAGRVVDVGDIALSAGGIISGRIVTTDGGVARRLQVSLTGPKVETPGLFGRYAIRLTDDLGRFAFPDLPPGSYEVYVRPAGSAERTSADVVLAAGGAVEDVVLTIAALWNLRVAVRNTQGEPVVGIRVSCVCEGGGMSARTGEDGIAAINGSGTPDSVTASGADVNGVVHVGPVVAITVLDRAKVTIPVEAAGQVSGVVTDPQGKPVAGAIVQVRRDGARLAEAVADESGRFSIAFPAGKTADLVFDGLVRKRYHTGAYSDAPVTSRGRREGVRAGESDVIIVAEKITSGGSLIVSVVSDRHAPVPGVRVVAQDHRGAELRSEVTGADGKCRLTDLPEFEVRVGIGRANGPAAFARFATADGSEIEIVVPDERLVIGRVEGVAIEGGLVVLTEDGVRIGHGRIDREGRFSAFLDRSYTRIRLVATARGRDGTEYEGVAENLPPGAREVVVRVSRRR